MPEEINSLVANTAEHIYDAVEHGDLAPRPLVELIKLAHAVKSYRNARNIDSPDTWIHYDKVVEHSNNLKALGI